MTPTPRSPRFSTTTPHSPRSSRVGKPRVGDGGRRRDRDRSVRACVVGRTWRARVVRMCALCALWVHARAYGRGGDGRSNASCEARTRHRAASGAESSSTGKPEADVGVTLGAVIRGTEWSGDTANDRAVLNAFDGLKRVVGVSNIVVFVDRGEMCEHVPSTHAGVRCFGLAPCVDPIYRAPTMKCIFQTLLDATQTKHVGYINGDILIFSDFLHTLAAIEREHDRFFMVGRRRNVPAPDGEVSRVEGELDWEELETKVCKFPVDGGGAIDYFVLPSRDAEYLRNIPPFIIGNWRWDNVVLSLASAFMDLHVIDATETVTALHQGQEKVARREDRPASAHNHGLAIHLMGKAYRRGSINCAKYESHYGTREQSNRVLLRAKRTLASWVCNHRESRAVSYMRHKMAT